MRLVFFFYLVLVLDLVSLFLGVGIFTTLFSLFRLFRRAIIGDNANPPQTPSPLPPVGHVYQPTPTRFYAVFVGHDVGVFDSWYCDP